MVERYLVLMWIPKCDRLTDRQKTIKTTIYQLTEEKFKYKKRVEQTDRYENACIPKLTEHRNANYIILFYP